MPTDTAQQVPGCGNGGEIKEEWAGVRLLPVDEVRLAIIDEDIAWVDVSVNERPGSSVVAQAQDIVDDVTCCPLNQSDLGSKLAKEVRVVEDSLPCRQPMDIEQFALEVDPVDDWQPVLGDARVAVVNEGEPVCLVLDQSGWQGIETWRPTVSAQVSHTDQRRLVRGQIDRVIEGDSRSTLLAKVRHRPTFREARHLGDQ